jgi:hypothetical protein
MPTYPIGRYWPWNDLIENLEKFGPGRVVCVRTKLFQILKNWTKEGKKNNQF